MENPLSNSSQESSEKLKEKLLELLTNHGATVIPDRFTHNAYIVTFVHQEEGATVTVRILFQDGTGSNVVITNMTVLPVENKGRGFGSEAVQKIIQSIEEIRMNEIRATQVEPENESFWIKNGFVKDSNQDATNDFIRKIS